MRGVMCQGGVLTKTNRDGHGGGDVVKFHGDEISGSRDGRRKTTCYSMKSDCESEVVVAATGDCR